MSCPEETSGEEEAGPFGAVAAHPVSTAARLTAAIRMPYRWNVETGDMGSGWKEARARLGGKHVVMRTHKLHTIAWDEKMPDRWGMDQDGLRVVAPSMMPSLALRHPLYPSTKTLNIMPYPEAMVQPMREELTRFGVEELTDAEAVDAAFEAAEHETMLLIINSVCGCAAGNARPAIALVQEADPQPDRYVTVFAGQDLDATERARAFLPGIPPSSPFMALFRNGDPVYIIQRKHIEGRSANAIASDLAQAFEAYCGPEEPPADAPSAPQTNGASAQNDLPSTFRSIS